MYVSRKEDTLHLDYLVSDLALILIAAAIVTMLFKKLKQPVVLGYIVAGFLISPNFVYLPTVVEIDDIHVWANIGVVFLMFGLGLEFSFKKIAKVGGSAFVIALTVMSAMILIGTGVGSLLGWGKMDCIFLGGMLSMSSTMIILKAYEEYDLKKEKFAQIVLGTLVIEDIAGIFMMIILTTISVSRNVSGTAMVKEIGLMLIFLIIWLLVGIYLIPTFLQKIKNLMNDEMILIIAVGICLGMVVIANLIGFSSALGAFMAGSILAGTVQAGRIERIVNPIKDLFGAIFFVSVGMMIQPELLVEYKFQILIITVVTILGQMIFSTAGMLLSGQSLHTAVRGGFSMVQIGEFSFIVASLGMSLGVISDFLYPIVVCVSVITSFTTPVFIKNSERMYRFIDDVIPDGLWVFIRKNTSENRSNDDQDKEWYLYIKKVAERTAVCSVFLFIFYWAGTRYLGPFISSHIEGGYTASIITAVIILACMTPFVNLMHGTNQALFTKLWLKHRANRLSLLTLKAVRILLAACFVALVLRKIFSIPFVLLVLIAAVPIVFIVRSDYINGMTINMEIRFMTNFSEKTLAKEKKERGLNDDYHWLNESLFVAEFQVTNAKENMVIGDFTKKPSSRVGIIRMIRDDTVINIPKITEPVQNGDILHMLGTEKEIEICTMLLEKDEHIEYTDRDDMTLKTYIEEQELYDIPDSNKMICCPIRVDSKSPFARKMIKHCGIRKKYRATIAGIERGDMPVIKPGKEVIIQPGDMLWVLGSKRMADELIKSDVLDN